MDISIDNYFFNGQKFYALPIKIVEKILEEIQNVTAIE